MEYKKESISSSSSSSFTADLFGTKESTPPSSSSSGIFASIFPPPSKVLGRKSSSSHQGIIGGGGSWQKQSSGNNPKQGLPGLGGNPNKDRKSIFVEERVEPCNLSSSLYYGGQDNYSQPPTAHGSGSGSYPILKKDGGEDDPNGSNSNTASRGNWWQGSLYY
ncbi:hypothetical protein M5689_002665 [Euphorbia peplus]|nr:hypothetical protein M5689_002665 [Euphorbia peplus]